MSITAKPATVLVGNLTDDPELRFTQSGIPVCSFRLAVNAWRGPDKEKASTYWNVTVWKKQGEHVAETLSKGDRAVVLGELTQRSYENDQGITVWVTEITAEEVAPSLLFNRRDRGGSKSSHDSPTAPPKADDVDVPF